MTGTGARAVLFDRYGGRDVLTVADVPMPTPGADEVVVAVKAAGINPGESAIRSGALQDRFPATFPSGEGSDLAGIVVAVGDAVQDFALDDAVLGFSWSRSSHATHVAVPVTQLIHNRPNSHGRSLGLFTSSAVPPMRPCVPSIPKRARPWRYRRPRVESGPSWSSSWPCGSDRSWYCLAFERRLAPLARRRTGVLRRWPGRTSAEGGTARHRRLHRSLRARVRPARCRSRHTA